MPDLTTAIASEVRRMIAERGWSGLELARRVDLPANNIAARLRGDRVMDFGTLQAIARACDVSVAYIVARAEAEVAHSPE